MRRGCLLGATIVRILGQRSDDSRIRETNQGFANYLMALGIIETCAIFALIFSLLALP